MTTVFLVRHGRTAWNRVERFRGRADLALDREGARQADASARRLTPLSAQAVYSSPLKRALETAAVIARPLALKVKALEGLTDIDYGEWEGLTPRQAARRFPEAYSLWQERPSQVTFPGGEGLGEVKERALAAFYEAASRHPGGKLVLVSHKVVCQVLVASLLGLPLDRVWTVRQDLCAINAFKVQGEEITVLFLNDTCHLEEG